MLDWLQKNVHQSWLLALNRPRGRERVAGLAAKRTFTIPCPWPFNPQVVNELLWVAAKRTFTSPGPWPLVRLVSGVVNELLEWRPKERSPSLAPGPFVFFTLFAGRLAEPARRVAGNPSVEGCPTLSHEICMREMTRGLRGQFGSYESVTRSLLSPLREVLVGRASRSSGRARFLCGRPRRVAAKLPQLGAAVRRAACTRGRRADVLDAARARARHRAAQFSPWTFLLLRRMVSCINMATLLLPHGLPIAAACSCTTCRRVCGDATDVMHGLHSTVFFVQCCGLMMASCSACMSTCCTIGMCVEAFDACCSDCAAYAA